MRRARKGTPRASGQFLDGRQRGVIVRLTGNFGYKLGIGYGTVRGHNHDGAGQQAQFVDEQAIILAETCILVLRKGLNSLYACSAAPAGLSKGASRSSRPHRTLAGDGRQRTL